MTGLSWEEKPTGMLRTATSKVGALIRASAPNYRFIGLMFARYHIVPARSTDGVVIVQ